MGINYLQQHFRFSSKEFSVLNVFVMLFFVLLSINVLLLDVMLIKQLTDAHSDVLGTKTTATKTTIASSCPNACVELINKSSGKSTTSTTSTKEFYISLGSGTTMANIWTNIQGAQATIDTTKYAKIKQVYFEPTVQNPNGNQVVWVRLYNETDGHPVWFSELSFEGITTKLLTSPLITLDSGNKRYQVQMKTQLQAPANLVQSRVHIITN